MIYQVEATLFFDELDEARDFKHDCEVALPKSIILNPDQPYCEPSIIQLIENHHDERPTAPCVVIEETNNYPH